MKSIARIAATLLAIAVTDVLAQAPPAKWPERPVRVVVPFAPGGATDVVARLIAQRLSEEFGQPFVIDNRAGAGGKIGVESVVRANPDGHTILIGASSHASNAALYKLPYDPIKGISPVTMIARGPFIIAVHPSVKAANIKEFIALAHTKPGSFAFGSSGTGSVPHLATEHFLQMAKTHMVHVPYKGDAPAIVGLIAGEVQFGLGGPVVLSPHINAGRLRGLAVTSEQRSPVMPDLPAVNEILPGYTAFSWFGMWAPPGTPKHIVDQLNRAVERALRNPQVQEPLRDNGLEGAHNTPEEFARLIATDIAKWNKVVKAGDIKVE